MFPVEIIFGLSLSLQNFHSKILPIQHLAQAKLAKLHGGPRHPNQQRFVHQGPQNLKFCVVEDVDFGPTSEVAENAAKNGLNGERVDVFLGRCGPSKIGPPQKFALEMVLILQPKNLTRKILYFHMLSQLQCTTVRWCDFLKSGTAMGS